MKTVCAWCKTVMIDEETLDGKISHGICELCVPIVLAEVTVRLGKSEKLVYDA